MKPNRFEKKEWLFAVFKIHCGCLGSWNPSSWKTTARCFYMDKPCLPMAHWAKASASTKRRYWPFVRGIHRSPVNSPHKVQRRGALMYSLICAWINGWVNNREAGGFKSHRTHYDVIVMNDIELVLPNYSALSPWRIAIPIHHILTLLRHFSMISKYCCVPGCLQASRWLK